LSDNPFDAQAWRPVDGFGDLTDITYHRHVQDATVRVAFNRPEVRNAFRPHTVDELYRALDHARMSPDVGAVGRFAPAAISASAAAPAINTPPARPPTRSTRPAPAACTSSRCSG
jgi:hypothetical protein